MDPSNGHGSVLSWTQRQSHFVVQPAVNPVSLRNFPSFSFDANKKEQIPTS